MRCEECHCALDFWPPNKAQSAPRTWQSARRDQTRQHAPGFEDGYASAGVVICARPLVVEMTAVDDFARGGVRAGNGCGDDCPVPRTDGGFYFGVEHDWLASLQTCAQGLRCLARDHESETGRLAGVQVS